MKATQLAGPATICELPGCMCRDAIEFVECDLFKSSLDICTFANGISARGKRLDKTVASYCAIGSLRPKASGPPELVINTCCPSNAVIDWRRLARYIEGGICEAGEKADQTSTNCYFRSHDSHASTVARRSPWASSGTGSSPVMSSNARNKKLGSCLSFAAIIGIARSPRATID